MKNNRRCFPDDPTKQFYAHYHDYEWGIPAYDDQHLFEMLCLEGAQAGLSWETILKKRNAYRALFYNFQPANVASMTDDELEKIIHNPKIIRNRKKIMSIRKNGIVFLEIQKEFGSFANYAWEFVDNNPIINEWRTKKQIPSKTKISTQLSNDLKKRGMTFVGPTIIYSFMQAVGMVNDHLISCPFKQ